MEVVTIQSEVFKSIAERIDEIHSVVKQFATKNEGAFLDNQQFIQLMNISKRLAQSWRDNGLISYVQINGKIYYLMADVKCLLDKNYKPATRNAANKKGGTQS